jgi:hypothetical protein
MKMPKLDFKKQYKQFYNASKNVEIVDVPKFLYLMADGKGNPGTTPAFQAITEALYSLSYTMKFAVKKVNPDNDYSVPPLEGFWWMDNMSDFGEDKKDEWKWTLLIAQPDFINKEIYESAQAEVLRKKKIDSSDVRFGHFSEGTCIQLLHIGPYNEEAANIQKMHSFMKENGYTFNGKHHEIYLSDPRKTSPDKLKTILRQPVKKI